MFLWIVPIDHPHNILYRKGSCCGWIGRYTSIGNKYNHHNWWSYCFVHCQLHIWYQWTTRIVVNDQLNTRFRFPFIYVLLMYLCLCPPPSGHGRNKKGIKSTEELSPALVLQNSYLPLGLDSKSVSPPPNKYIVHFSFLCKVHSFLVIHVLFAKKRMHLLWVQFNGASQNES